jgi:hypothetical protein
MNRRKWLLSIIGWDGCLPLLVAISPTILPLFIAGRDLAELTAVILVPILAALVRAHQGRRQLDRRGARSTLGRQCVFGSAIVVLLLFEALVGVLSYAPDAPNSAWFAAGTLYLVYLGLIVRSLRPPRFVEA